MEVEGGKIGDRNIELDWLGYFIYLILVCIKICNLIKFWNLGRS